jgi:hypothetical protein
MSLLRHVIVVTLAVGMFAWYIEHLRWRRDIDAVIALHDETASVR